MSESTPHTTLENATWGAALEPAVCEHCNWRYLVPYDAPAPICPNCYFGPLSILPGALVEMPHPYPPELVLPFQVPDTRLASALDNFRTGIPFAPTSLSSSALSKRLQKVYLPLWLVDADVQALWDTEVGFDYEVVSHEEFYDQNQNGWRTKEVKEPRVRWEKRVGKLDRSYKNCTAPAMEDAPRLEKQLGPFQQDTALPYQPSLLEQALVRLPDLPPDQAWTEAAAAFQKAAAQECQQASGANHFRQFQWKAKYAGLNWTLMLLPVYTTSYLDDQGTPQPVMIHGQTGQAAGARRASLKRAGRTSLVILLVSIAVILLGLLADLALAQAAPQLAVFSIIMLLAGLIGIPASAVPYAVAWDFNHRKALQKRATQRIG